jgi:hypothetical protein
MIRHWVKSALVGTALLLLAGTLMAATPVPAADAAAAESVAATAEAEFDPGIIPTSAVATSDNCAVIAGIEEQMERNITVLDLQRIQGPELGPPLGVKGKFKMALLDTTDPVAIFSNAIDAEMGNATDGAPMLQRGALGFAQRFGMSMAGQATGEAITTFAISSVFHQDPRYHRDPSGSTKARIFHALTQVVITRSDSGKPMFNVSEFLGTPLSFMVANTYNPEWKNTPGADAGRVFVSIGSDSAWNLLTEFLPDIARRVNPKWIILRRLAQHVSDPN